MNAQEKQGWMNTDTHNVGEYTGEFMGGYMGTPRDNFYRCLYEAYHTKTHMHTALPEFQPCVYPSIQLSMHPQTKITQGMFAPILTQQADKHTRFRSSKGGQPTKLFRGMLR